MIRNNWGAQNYEWAMSLKGQMSRRQAENETGIPADTIAKWWLGKTPYHLRECPGPGKQERCRRGHPLVGSNIIRVRGGKRQCRRCKVQSDRRYGYRRRGQFHPVYNPDPSCAPLERLWFPAGPVLAFIHSRISSEDARTTLYRKLGGKDTAQYKRYYELCAGRRQWIRYDTADALFVALGLVVSEMDAEPVYSAQSPRSGEQAAA